MSEVQKVRFPGGKELTVPPGMTFEEFSQRHLTMSLLEGMCPHHLLPLTVAQGDSAYSPGSGLPWLYHLGCSWYWQVNTANEVWTQESASAWLGLSPDAQAVAQ